MNLNKKGFTLIEVIAVVVILSVIMAISAPNIYNLVEQNKEDSYNKLKKSFIESTKLYISDNRYNLSLESIPTKTCTEIKVTHINGQALTNGVSLNTLVEKKYLSYQEKDSIKYIANPKNKSTNINLSTNYVTVYYNCKTKDFNYYLNNVKNKSIDEISLNN